MTAARREDARARTGDGSVTTANMPLCPEHDLRAAMTDDEFWAHVFPQTVPDGWDCEPSVIDQEDMANLSHLATPCPECGQWGACAYDAEGRALIHVTQEADDA